MLTLTSIGSEPNKLEMTKTANTIVCTSSLQYNWLTSLYLMGQYVWCRNGYGFATAVASWLGNISWRIQIPRDKKPRGEADRIFRNGGRNMGGNKATHPKGVATCPPGNLQIILFPPLSLCSHRGTALRLRIAPGNWGEKGKGARVQYRI